MIWGETGTRHGATRLQLASVAWLWSRYAITELHDGDCVGADAQLYNLALALDVPSRVIHPPTNRANRAFCGEDDSGLVEPGTTVLGPRPYFVRDRDVVDAAAVMVGIPLKAVEMAKGGTWYTIRYTRSLGKPLAIVWPNGFITYENWNLEQVTD